MQENSTRVPLMALWPPMTLIAADIALLVLAIWLRIDLIAVALAVGLVLLVLDLRGRKLDYRNALKHLVRGRDPARVAKAYQFSWCGRVACQQAAFTASSSAGRAVIGYYRQNGYRWFHIFPDNTFTLSTPFLTARFWSITLGGNSRARLKLEEIEMEEQQQTSFSKAAARSRRIRSAIREAA